MNTIKIQSADYNDLKVSSLPTNPTADPIYGGLGYNATQMKEAFDALALFAIERLKMLIEDIFAAPDKSIATVMQTGIYPDHTLKTLFDDIISGDAAHYFTVGKTSLATAISDIKKDIEELKKAK